jgi:hypothetical protein
VVVFSRSFDLGEPADNLLMGDFRKLPFEWEVAGEPVFEVGYGARPTRLPFLFEEEFYGLWEHYGLRSDFAEGLLREETTRLCTGLGEAYEGIAADRAAGVVDVEDESLRATLREPDAEARKTLVPIVELSAFGWLQRPKRKVGNGDL